MSSSGDSALVSALEAAPLMALLVRLVTEEVFWSLPSWQKSQRLLSPSSLFDGVSLGTTPPSVSAFRG